jgi:hypothetical protein
LRSCAEHRSLRLSAHLSSRVLLPFAVDPVPLREPFWFTVGSGTDDSERESEAATRAPFEKTGTCIAATQERAGATDQVHLRRRCHDQLAARLTRWSCWGQPTWGLVA